MSSAPLVEVPPGLAHFVEKATASQRALIVWRAYQAVALVRGVISDEFSIKVRGLTQGQLDDLRKAADGLDGVLP